jgi:hypothetical protein
VFIVEKKKKNPDNGSVKDLKNLNKTKSKQVTKNCDSQPKALIHAGNCNTRIAQEKEKGHFWGFKKCNIMIRLCRIVKR